MEVEIKWDNRYSSTLEDDNMGRWAKVAYAGRFDNVGFLNEKVCRWQIAWISKIDLGDKKFMVRYDFPNWGKTTFDTLEQAKLEVEEKFRWFIQMCASRQELTNTDML